MPQPVGGRKSFNIEMISDVGSPQKANRCDDCHDTSDGCQRPVIPGISGKYMMVPFSPVSYQGLHARFMWFYIHCLHSGYRSQTAHHQYKRKISRNTVDTHTQYKERYFGCKNNPKPRLCMKNLRFYLYLVIKSNHDTP